jgi:CheY-like chemotaxis protein
MKIPANINVLVIEDDREDARLIEDLFGESRRSKFSIDIAYTAAQGKEKLQGHKYDVVLLDYMLPDQDGLAFLQELNPDNLPPVILVTNHRNLQNKAIQMGASGYLEKGEITSYGLEMTCLAAIDKPLDIVIEELVSLTKQVATNQEQMMDNLNSLKEYIQDEMMDEIKNISRGRWYLDWIAKHPWVAALIFSCLLSTAVTAVALLDWVDLDKAKNLIETATKEY